MTKGVKSKECPRCGAQYFCNADSDQPCWCMNYTINPDNLKVLGEKYKGCLCPDCLKLYAQKKS